MTTGKRSSQRHLAYGLIVACLALIVWSTIQFSATLGEARSAALTAAAQAIVPAITPAIEQTRVPRRLVATVHTLVAQPGSALNYVTVYNAADQLLVSEGRFGDRFSWLSEASARQWRGWAYQIQSAETRIALSREATPVGSVRYGVDWFAVAARAGAPLGVWGAAGLAGLIGLLGAWRSLRHSHGAPAAAEHGETRKQPRPATKPEPKRAKKIRRKRGSDPEFAPIGGAPAAVPQDESPPETAAASTPSPVSAAAPPAPPKAAAGPGEKAAASAASVSTAAARVAGDVQQARTAAAPAPSAAKPPPASTVAAPAAESAATAGAALHAPSLDAQPRLGDDTLDLRFYPIWRDRERAVLAGACAALAWRVGKTQLVNADTLTRLAEQDGALRAFTQWIARRFSLLHSNWRTLELATVPIVLPIPSAMLAFADAEAVWRDALRRTDRDPNDLVLRLSRRSRRYVHSALPVRRAITLAGHDRPLPSDCDIACIEPDQIGDDIEAWRARVEELRCPVLLGPINDVERYTALVEHSRVLWYSDSDDSLYTPRAFARLLARHTSDGL